MRIHVLTLAAAACLLAAAPSHATSTMEGGIQNLTLDFADVNPNDAYTPDTTGFLGTNRLQAFREGLYGDFSGTYDQTYGEKRADGALQALNLSFNTPDGAGQAKTGPGLLGASLTSGVGSGPYSLNIRSDYDGTLTLAPSTSVRIRGDVRASYVDDGVAPLGRAEGGRTWAYLYFSTSDWVHPSYTDKGLVYTSNLNTTPDNIGGTRHFDVTYSNKTSSPMTVSIYATTWMQTYGAPIPAVPEAETTALVLAGLAVLGLVRSKRRIKNAS